MFDIIGTYEYNQQQRDLFKTGALAKEWYKTYPTIFDEQDLRIAINQAKDNYHFFEWLAAVLLYQSLGFSSLVEQYEFKVHKRKRDILQQVLTHDMFELVTNHKNQFTGVQSPDLFVYSPDYSEWFFCEVKGPRDKLTNTQKVYFKALSETSKKPVRIVQFKLYNS